MAAPVRAPDPEGQAFDPTLIKGELIQPSPCRRTYGAVYRGPETKITPPDPDDRDAAHPRQSLVLESEKPRTEILQCLPDRCSMWRRVLQGRTLSASECILAIREILRHCFAAATHDLLRYSKLGTCPPAETNSHCAKIN